MATTAAEAFRENVVEMAREQGMSMSTLAELSGTSQANMSRIVNGHEKVTIQRAERISQALGVPLSEILRLSQKIA